MPPHRLHTRRHQTQRFRGAAISLLDLSICQLDGPLYAEPGSAYYTAPSQTAVLHWHPLRFTGDTPDLPSWMAGHALMRSPTSDDLLILGANGETIKWGPGDKLGSLGSTKRFTWMMTRVHARATRRRRLRSGVGLSSLQQNEPLVLSGKPVWNRALPLCRPAATLCPHRGLVISFIEATAYLEILPRRLLQISRGRSTTWRLSFHGETQMGWSLSVRRSSRLTESQSDMCRAR
jgi:hypothetical protein